VAFVGPIPEVRFHDNLALDVVIGTRLRVGGSQGTHWRQQRRSLRLHKGGGRGTALPRLHRPAAAAGKILARVISPGIDSARSDRRQAFMQSEVIGRCSIKWPAKGPWSLLAIHRRNLGSRARMQEVLSSA